MEWILNGTCKEKLEVTRQQDERFQLNLEMAVRLGKTLVIRDVQDIEPVLYPLLRRDLSGQGVYKSIPIGDKTVDFNPEFRLVISTRNAKPNLQPGKYIHINGFATCRAISLSTHSDHFVVSINLY